MVKHLTRYLQILLIGTLCITLISCAGKRRGAGEPSAVPGATEPAPSAVTEEQIGGPVSLDPDRLKAFEALKAAALQEGALGFSISGAGPSMFALCDNSAIADAILESANRLYKDKKIPVTTYFSKINQEGAIRF